jgi:hypothetical protein
MNKTMEDWRIELNDLFMKSANDAAIMMANMQSEIMIAFCTKYGIPPNECILCYQGNQFWVEKKECKWINVKDKLPPKWKKVLVYAKYFEAYQDQLNEHGDWSDSDPQANVTHWMPLPEAPINER